MEQTLIIKIHMAIILTQAEMDDILQYAKTKNIALIPAINSPRHMDAILDAMEQLGIKDARFSYNGKNQNERLI